MVGEISAVITGTGSYTPSKVLTNADFEKMVETSDDWIRSRTGITERRINNNGDGTSEMAFRASKLALERSNLQADQLDLILFGTVTPDYPVPAAACILQNKLGAWNAAAMDICAACASFVYALTVAEALVRAGTYRRVLVIGAESLSTITNYEDRTTCVLFGDGAGAVIVEAQEGKNGKGILGSVIRTDGSAWDYLWVPMGGSVEPLRQDNVEKNRMYVEMAGKEVFKLAVKAMHTASLEACEKAGIDISEVDLLVPHQANIRIIQALMKRMNLSEERVFINIEKYGNTSSASVPIALDEAYTSGRIKKGDTVLLTAFGGGMAWGAVVVKF